MAIKSQKIVADFETITDPNDARVWAVCAVDIPTAKTVYMGNNIDDFMMWLSSYNTECYYHNLKFDGSYLISWLLRNGYTHFRREGADAFAKRKVKPKAKTFETMITDEGVFYSIIVYFEVGNKKYRKVKFLDSYKKLPFKVSEISKAFKLEDKKLHIDYQAYRAPGHELTEQEKAYIVNDCRIVAQALKIQMDKGLTHMTNASDAMHNYKETITERYFEKQFPVLTFDVDAKIRKAYKGGFVYLNPKYKGKEVPGGLTFDVNSLYPWVLYTKLLPYGYPSKFEGEPVPDPDMPLYIVNMWCKFDLKPGHIPTIQLKNNRAYVETEYLTSSNGEITNMTVTNVDLELMREHYVITNVHYEWGYKFKAKKDMFKDYIDYWMHIKETTKGAERSLSKLMLNSIYGRFAMNPEKRDKSPFLDHDGIVQYHLSDKEIDEPVYTAMGCFVTAYAREKTIRTSQSMYDRWIYSDTDSCHIEGYEEPDIDIHPTRLGAWKNEGAWFRGKFIRSKTYLESVEEYSEDAKLSTYAPLINKHFDAWREGDRIHYHVHKVTCAGMPDNVKDSVTYDNFHAGATFDGKLMPKACPGGTVLVERTFTIKF